VSALIAQWDLEVKRSSSGKLGDQIGTKADSLAENSLKAYEKHYRGLTHFCTWIGDYESLVMLDNFDTFEFCPSIRRETIMKYLVFKTSPPGTPLRHDGIPVCDTEGKPIDCEGGWKAPKNVSQFASAITILHRAKGQSGDYADVCTRCREQDEKGNYAGCKQHRNGPRVWRRGLPNFDFEVQNVVKAIKNDRREYREMGNAYMLPQELHAIRESMVKSGTLENLQLWVMIIVATKLFLRADEDPENPEKAENCINWRLSAMANGHVTRLAFNIRGKADKAGSVALTIWEETVINNLDAIRPLLAYIHLAKIKGGFLFPCASELSSLRNGEGNGISRQPMSYNVFLEKLKAACKPHVLDRDSFGTHTLRKTAYALAVFGGASDIEIMNAARHKCTKSASTYKQDAFF
ncbi:hypothetical protein HDU96_004232, partial [Phlyctochytrium bullatum]